MGYFDSKKVAITGGAWFLGRFVVDGLRDAGCENVFAPRSEENDLASDPNDLTIDFCAEYWYSYFKTDR